MTPAILSARALMFSYGDVAGLDRLSLEVSEGRRLAIVGANGAGKTTLLLHLNGTNRPAAGAVLLRGEPVAYDRAGLTALRTAVGLVFQNPDDQLFAGSVYQDVSFGPLNIGLSEDVTRDRVEEALESLEIAHLRDRPTHMLSYGQKKRAAIAGAVAMRPDVLILDEPMAGLDPSGSWHLMGLLTRLHEAGTTLVVATHDMSLAYEWADEVAVLRDGSIVAHGEPQDVMHDPAELAHSGLRMPWVADIAQTLRDCGVLPPDVPSPRTRDELKELIARRCGVGRGGAVG
ncbi:MAG TPA: ATP-binding cassette domain-containing protein [Thermoleophilia bacterium]|nr:ATP-binding cassette domain-containing protein [Thermoleophilia bacterium]